MNNKKVILLILGLSFFIGSSMAMDVDTCIVCDTHIEDEGFSLKQCKHNFHIGCLNKKLKDNNACPSCACALPSDFVDKHPSPLQALIEQLASAIPPSLPIQPSMVPYLAIDLLRNHLERSGVEVEEFIGDAFFKDELTNLIAQKRFELVMTIMYGPEIEQWPSMREESRRTEEELVRRRGCCNIL